MSRRNRRQGQAHEPVSGEENQADVETSEQPAIEDVPELETEVAEVAPPDPEPVETVASAKMLPPLPYTGHDAVPCTVIKPVLWANVMRKPGTPLQVGREFFERHSRLGSLKRG